MTDRRTRLLSWPADRIGKGASTRRWRDRGGHEGIEHPQCLWNAYRVKAALGEDARGVLARAQAAVTGRLAIDREITARWEREGRPEVPAREASTFVGRKQEIAALRNALGRAARSEGGLWLVAGEPGMGKTRLVEELARAAEREGFAVRWGRGDEARVVRDLARATGGPAAARHGGEFRCVRRPRASPHERGAAVVWGSTISPG